MTLAKIIDTLKMIALKHPNINSAYEGNIYDILNAKSDNKYASVVLTQQSHTTDETYDHYGFVIFYVDRLVDDLEENRVQIQSIGKSMLGNIITAFCNEFEAECGNISFQPFTQRFADETAGVYCTITIDTVKDVYCAERYWDESWTTPIVSIKNVDMTITLTENGHYTLDYDPTIYTGIGKVDIDVELNTEPYYNDGYGKGYNDGVSEQKSKLETISITENGVYSNEDGYNHIEVNVPDLNGSYDEGYNQGYTEGKQVSYGEGYEQGQADVAANARVLEVIENGSYYSKYSDIPTPENVTGRYDDGRDFYNYATVKNAVYNTNIIPTQYSKITIWVNLNKEGTGDAYFVLLSNNVEESDRSYFQIRYHSAKKQMEATIGATNIYFDVPQGWCTIEMSVADGLRLNGEKLGDFKGVEIVQEPIWLNGSFDTNCNRNINGQFGMIKIDDNVIIPTENGFMNNGEILEVIQNGVYTFVDSVIIPEGPLFKTVNVNIQPKINVEENGLQFGYSTFDSISDVFDFEGITNLKQMFYSCANLKTIPQFDTSKVKTMYYTFYGCYNLQSIPKIDCSGIDTSYNSAAFFGSSTLNNLTDIGGFENLKISSNSNYGLAKTPNLTYESCINILNGLYDFTGNGETPNSSQGVLKVHQNFLNNVGEEISIGTNKGWTITT